MSSKILVKTICILTIFILIKSHLKTLKNKKISFIKIEQKTTKYNSFLQPIQTIIYQYNGSITDLNNLLSNNKIKYTISTNRQIYICIKDEIEFEIRINKLNNEYQIQFIPVVCAIDYIINQLII